MRKNSYTEIIFCSVMTIVIAITQILIMNEKLGYLGYSNSFVSVVFLAVMYYITRNCYRMVLQADGLDDIRAFFRNCNRRRMGFSLVFSGLFSLAIVWGKGLDENGEIPVAVPTAWVAYICFTVLVFFYMYSFLAYLDSRKNLAQDVENTAVTGKSTGVVDDSKLMHTENSKEGNKKEKEFPLWLIFAGFVVCFLVILLAVYPGFFVYDAADEFSRVAGRWFNTHHPLIHVALLGGVICLVHKISGSYNLGIFCYTLLQTMILSGLFTYLIWNMREWGVAKKYRIATFIYLAIFPVNVMFVLCSTKDTLGGGCLLLVTIELINIFVTKSKNGERNSILIKEQNERVKVIKKKEYLHQILLVISLFGAISFRNNVIYAILVCAIVLLLIGLMTKKINKYRTVVALMLLSVVLAWGSNKVLIKAFHAVVVGPTETITVPIQQIARLWNDDPTQFSEGETLALMHLFRDNGLEQYTPNLSDPVKNHFYAFEYDEYKDKFWRAWAKGLIHHPVAYINAWFMTSYGYWYPDTIVNVYEGHDVYTFTYKDSSFFGYETEYPGERHSYIPFLDELYRKMSLEIAQQRIPGISMMFSMGFLFWIYFFVCWIRLYYKKLDLIIPFLPIAFVWLTLLLGPTYLPRYVTFLWFILPTLLCIKGNEK